MEQSLRLSIVLLWLYSAASACFVGKAGRKDSQAKVDTVFASRHLLLHRQSGAPKLRKELACLLCAFNPTAAFERSLSATCFPGACSTAHNVHLITPERILNQARNPVVPAQRCLGHFKPKMSAEDSALARCWREVIEETTDLMLFIQQPAPSPRLPGRAAGPRLPVWWRRVLFWSLASACFQIASEQSIFEAGSLAGFDMEAVKQLNEWVSSFGKETSYEEVVVKAILVGAPLEELLFRFPLRSLPPWAYFLPEERMHLAREGSRIFFSYAVRVSTVVFALVHLSNYDLDRMQEIVPLWFPAALLVPQFIGGVTLTWLRVRCGMGAATASHMLINSVYLSLLINGVLKW